MPIWGAYHSVLQVRNCCTVLCSVMPPFLCPACLLCTPSCVSDSLFVLIALSFFFNDLIPFFHPSNLPSFLPCYPPFLQLCYYLLTFLLHYHICLDRGEFIEGTTNRLVTIAGAPDCAQTAHHLITQKLHQVCDSLYVSNISF